MNQKYPQLKIGETLTLKRKYLLPGGVDFPMGGRDALFDKIRRLPHMHGSVLSSELYILARITDVQDFSFTYQCCNIRVEFLNPFECNKELGVSYLMLESDFLEYVSPIPNVINSGSGTIPIVGHIHSGTPIGTTGSSSLQTFTGTSTVVLGHTHVAPGSYSHGYDLGIKVDPNTFKEVNPETQLSFKSTKLVANKIQNSKEIDNFLLLD